MKLDFRSSLVKTNYVLNSAQYINSNSEWVVFGEEVEVPMGYTLSYESPLDAGSEIFYGNLLLIGPGGDEAGRIHQPIYWDSGNDRNTNNIEGAYKIVQTGAHTFMVYIVVPASWLTSPSRVYPVTIDPIVTQSSLTQTASCFFPSYQAAALPINVPLGTITNTYLRWDFRAVDAQFAWIEDQRSYVSGPNGSTNVFVGAGAYGGVYAYTTNTTIANTSTHPGGSITFTFYASRVWGGSACDLIYNYLEYRYIEVTYFSSTCNNFQHFHSNVTAPCATYTTTNTIGPGQHQVLNAYLGSSYTINTCGTYNVGSPTFNSQISGYQGGSAVVFYNDDNGSLCTNAGFSGSSSFDAWVDWISPFTGTVQIQVTRYNCQSWTPTTGSAILRVRENPPGAPATPTLTPPGGSYCAGQNILLNMVGTPALGITYYWQTSPVGTNTANSGSTYTVSTNGTYYLRPRSGSGCWGTASAGVTVTFYPGISNNTISASQTICAGTDPADIIGTSPTGGLGVGTYNYGWEFSTDFGITWNACTGINNAPNYDSPILTTTTWYRRWVLSGPCPAHVSNIVIITVEPVIVPGTISASQSICYNTVPASLTGSPPSGGTGTHAYQWQSTTVSGCGSGWANISGATAFSYAPGSLTTTTCYRRQITSGVCPVAFSNTVTITVYADLTPGSVAANQSICYNTSPAAFTQTAAATGGPGSYAYQWQQQIGCVGGWSDIIGATATTYNFTGNLLQTTCFRRRVTSGSCAQVYSNTITVTVYDEVTPGTVAANQSVCYNTPPAAFTNVALPAGGVGAYTYQWQQQINCSGVWSDITGATASTLNYTSNLIQTTCFRRRVVNTCGTVFSNIITVTVYPNLTPGSVGNNQSICYNTSPAAFVNIQLPTGGTGPFTYQWQQQPGCSGAWSNITGATASTYNFTGNLTQTTCYRRVVTNTCGTVNSTAITVLVYGNLTAGTIAASQSICYNQVPAPFTNSASPTGGSGSYSYQWQIQVGCAGGWSNITGATSNIYTHITPLTQNTCFRRQVTDICGGPLNSNTITITVFSQTVVSFTGLSGPYCINQTTPVPLTGTPLGGTFTGNGIQGNNFVPYLAAVGSNAITYTYTDGNGCTNSQTQNVVVNGLPVVSFAGLSGTYCENSSVPVPLTGFPSGGTFSGPGISGSNFIPSIAGAGFHQITYTYQDGNGCVNSSTQSVHVSPLPLITFTGLASSYCINSPNVTLTGFPVGGTFSGPGISGSTFSPTTAGTGIKTITYTFTNTYGCINTTTQNTTVYALPTVNFSGLQANYCINSPAVPLTGNPAGGTFTGTGISGNAFYPSIAGLGNKSITYTYTNANNCTNSQTQNTTVNNVPVITSTDTIYTCSGQSVNYTITSTIPGSSFTWTSALIVGTATGYNSGSGASINDVIVNISPNAALVKYVITPTSPGTPPCVGSPLTLIVIVRPYPSLFAGNDAATCSNVPYTIADATTDVSNNIMWTTSGLGSFNIPTLMNPTYTPSVNEFGNINLMMTVTNQLGCPKTDTIVLSISYAPIANAGNNQTINCGGAGIVIGSAPQPNYVYNWTPVAGLNNPNVAQPLANPLTHTTYILTVTDTINGCFDTDDVIVTVSGAPTANAGPNQSINCGGAGIVIGTPSVSGMSYNWSPAAGLNNANIAQPMATPLSNTTYILTVTNLSTGCYATDDMILTVNGAPTANAGPDQSINCGGTTGVVIGSSAQPGMSYNWLPAAGLSNPNIAQPLANPLSNTTYVLTVTNLGTGCYATDNMVLTVIGAPTADAGLDKSINCGGSTGTLIGTAGVSGFSYNWLPTTGLNNPNIAQPTANPLSNTTYHLIVTDLATGCFATDEMSVTVIGSPNADAGANQSINCGGVGTVIGTVSVPGMAYSWSPSNTLSNANIAQPTATPLGNTTYVVTVTNIGTGCYNTDDVTITVIGAPVASAGLDQSINCGGPGTIIGSPFVSGMAYTWIPSTGLNNPNIAQPMATPYTHTNYTLIVTNIGSGCYATDNVSITVIGAPPANAGPNQTIGCGGPGTTIGMPAVSGMSYTWSPSYALSATNTAQPTATPLGNTTYYLTVTNMISGCYGVDSVTITVAGAPVANAGIDKTINCGGAGVTIGTTAVSGMTYTWLPPYALNNASVAQPIATPLGNTTYYLTVTQTSTGCFGTDMVNVNVLGTPIVNAGLNQSIPCGGPGVLIGTNGISGIGYTWTPTNGLNNASIDKPLATPYSTTNYIVTGTNLGTGCFATDAVLVTVVGVPSVYAGADASVCANANYNIIDATSSNSFVIWTHNGIGNLSNNTTIAPTYQPLIAEFGVVTLTMTAVCNADTASDYMLLTVFPHPIATFSELDSAYCIDNPGDLLIGYPSGGIFSGNGLTGNFFSPSNAGVGTHVINYTYTDANGCVKDTAKTTIVNPLPVVSFTNLDPQYCPYDASYLMGTPIGGTFSGNGMVGNMFYASISGIGVFDITYTYQDNNGCINSQTQQTEVTALSFVDFSGLATEYCVYEAPVTLTGIPAGGIFSGPGITGNTFSPAVAGVGTHSINYIYFDSNNCMSDVTKTVIVHPEPVPVINGLNSTYCVNSPPVIMSGFPAGGTFSGTGVNINTFYPSYAGVGTHQITYSYIDANSCLGSTTLSVTILPLTPVSFTGLSPTYCVNDYASPLNGNPFGGTYAGPGIVSDFFHPSIAGAGTYDITYTYTDMNGCTNVDTQAVTIHPLTPVDFTGLPAQYCLNGTPLTLTGIPVGGTFSGTAITGNTFNPTTAGVGVHGITYTYTDGNTCTNQITKQVDVLPLPAVDFVGLNAEYCIDALPVTLIGFPTGGAFSGPGITANIFNAGVAGAGTHSISYSFTDANSCTNTETKIVTVHALPVVTLAPLADVCPNSPFFNLSGGTPVGGTFSGNGVNNNIFYPDIAGVGLHNITYSFMDINQCVNTETQAITVNPLPVLTITGLNTVYCYNAPTDNLTGTPAGGYFIGPGISGNTFNATNAGVGVHQVGYVYTDANVCTDTLTYNVTVLSLPHMALSGIDTVYCIDAPPVTIGGFPLGGTFSGPGMNGNFFTAYDAGVGVHDILYAYTDTSGCTDTIIHTLTINGLPNLSLVPFVDICLFDAPFMLTNGTPVGGTYSGPGVVNNVLNPYFAGSGTHLITYAYQDALGCINNISDSITIHTNPTVSFELDFTEICSNDPQVLLTEGLPLGGVYSGPGVVDSLFLPPLANIGINFVYYTYTDTNNCSTTDSSFVKVHQAPVAYAGGNISICSGTATNLIATGGDFYLWNTNETTPEITVAPLDTTMFTVIAYNYNSNNNFICSDTDTVIVSIIPLPEVFLTSDADNNVISIGQQIVFTAVPSNYDLYEFYINTNLVQSELIPTYTSNNFTSDFTIYVIAKDSACVGNPDSLFIRVKPVSNAFTPDGDGKNDIFMKGYDVRIYNRWGQLLYEGIDGWDGTFNGEPLPGATYFYVTTIYNDARTEIISILKGSILLIRE